MVRAALFLLALAVPAAEPVRILVAYHSDTGHTEKLARAIREGAARVAGVETTVRPVAEVKPAEITAARGIVLGTPVHWHNLSAVTKKFLDTAAQALQPGGQWGEGRTAGVFTTAGNPSAGQEMARLSMISAFLSMRFVVIGGLNREGYGNLGPQAVTAGPAPGVPAAELEEARRYGERFAKLTLQFSGNLK
jgi:NAD(P)H dehydrogenase (quinone)